MANYYAKGFRLSKMKKTLLYVRPTPRETDTEEEEMATNLDVALKLAYTAPQRPFGRDFRNDCRQELTKLFKQNIEVKKDKQTIKGKRYSFFEPVLADDFGQKALSMWQAWIYDGSYYKAHAPNSPNTVKKNPMHEGLPLVDTTQLLNALDYKQE